MRRKVTIENVIKTLGWLTSFYQNVPLQNEGRYFG